MDTSLPAQSTSPRKKGFPYVLDPTKNFLKRKPLQSRYSHCVMGLFIYEKHSRYILFKYIVFQFFLNALRFWIKTPF